MSITAVGPALDLVGPLPVAPEHSLLNTPGVVVDRDAGRWMNGVNVLGYPADTPSLWEPCSDGTFRLKEEGEGLPQERFDPLVAYTPVTCSAIGLRDPEELARKAEVALDATISFAVETALAQGDVLSNNPFFGDVNLDILGGGAVTPQVGLSYLENAIGLTGRQGMIHATPAVIAAWDQLSDRDVLETSNGTPVVSGGGYIGTDPASGSTPAAGQDWVFATGPVEVRIGPLVITDLAQTLDRSDNTLTFRAERYVLAFWDGVLQAGVLVDWSP